MSIFNFLITRMFYRYNITILHQNTILFYTFY